MTHYSITALDLAFLLAMLVAFITGAQANRGEVRTRVALAQCTAEAELLADACGESR